MSHENLYEHDYLGWLEQQKQVLTSGNWEKLDTAHLFEELAGMSRSRTSTTSKSLDRAIATPAQMAISAESAK
ncbi:MAG: DUF29 family protein [bacterium]